MESTGAKNKIQISSFTRDLLYAAGKSHWAEQREDKIIAKGKGEMTTFWLVYRGSQSQKSGSSSGVATDEDTNENSGDDEVWTSGDVHISKKYQRLVQWNAEMMFLMLKDIKRKRTEVGLEPESEKKLIASEKKVGQVGCLVEKELRDVVILPPHRLSDRTKENTEPTMDPKIFPQLVDFVRELCLLYRPNPFHNFDHASHVAMSAIKLLKRVGHSFQGMSAYKFHENTFGCTDPMTQFAVMFSALIHDAGHPGVPNSVLSAEKDALARQYKKSPAEQHSVAVSWTLLQNDKYHALRRAIYCTSEEMHRFRDLLVCCVLATDIADKEFSRARMNRWKIAFDDATENQDKDSTLMNRKATIILEHLVQASDVAHSKCFSAWPSTSWRNNAHLINLSVQQCNTGMYFENGTRNYSSRIWKHMNLAESEPTPWKPGMKGNWVSLTFTSSLWQRSFPTAVCSIRQVKSSKYQGNCVEAAYHSFCWCSLNYAKSNRAEWEMRGREIVQELAHAYAQWKVDPSKE